MSRDYARPAPKIGVQSTLTEWSAEETLLYIANYLSLNVSIS